MSTDKSLYRYNIETSADISESTFLRRQVKLRQNNKTRFIFCLPENFSHPELLTLFLNGKCTDQDLILTKPNPYELICAKIKHGTILMQIENPTDFDQLAAKPRSIKKILLTPKTKADLKMAVSFYKTNSDLYEIYWSFAPYDPNLIQSLTVKEIAGQKINYNRLPGLDITNLHIPKHYELEPLSKTSYQINWSLSSASPQPDVSVIIPTFNNCSFLSNVVWHVLQQNRSRDSYEIIIVDDGSTDSSSAILQQLFENQKGNANIKYIYWSKEHPTRGEQKFFRSGLARNLAARYSRGNNLLFLDSDMLVPVNFIDTVKKSLAQNDIIQFQRFHINQELSRKNPAYSSIQVSKHTYIEEKNYWSELFFSDQWSQLPFYWKYTCTYALGMTKENFYKMGLFKKYYVSYGFEDTDIGYEAHKLNLKFALIKMPLLHLTAYDSMQYKNSASKRFALLKKTAELFYLQHLDHDIYTLLGNYYRVQKPLKSYLRDLVS